MKQDAAHIELGIAADDADEFEMLYEELQRLPGVAVHTAASPLQTGDQGVALDLLTIALSSGGVTALLRLLTVLAESRGPKFRLEIRRGKNRVRLTSSNASEAIPLIKDILDGS